ncbi:MAG: ribosome silencing factor [Treponema sp.]|nr:ribosome silencing factor [Treponema sp.]
MEDMSAEINYCNAARELEKLLDEHKGQDVSVLDLRAINNWTDFFIIATVTSKTHMDGLERHIKEYCHENKININGSSRKSSDDEWRLIDLGPIIIHLMTSPMREFYDLERLWRPLKHAEGV